MKKIIQDLFGSVLRWVCMVFPKRKNLILMGTPYCKFYNDNSKYFFQYLFEKKTSEVDFYIVTKNKKLFQLLRKKFGSHALYSYSFRALFVYLRAKTVIITHGQQWVNIYNICLCPIPFPLCCLMYILISISRNNQFLATSSSVDPFYGLYCPRIITPRPQWVNIYALYIWFCPS